MSDETMVSVKEAAERFGISAQTMRNWCKDGQVPGAVRGPNNRWQVPESALPEAEPKAQAEPEPEAVDTSSLAPADDAELLDLFEIGQGYGDDDQGAAEETRPGGEDPSDEPTMDEVLDTVRQLREAANALGVAAGALHDGLTALEQALGGREPERMDDAAALEELLSGGADRAEEGEQPAAPLADLDEVLDAEPEVELDTDPRETWETEADDPRETWEADDEL